MAEKTWSTGRVVRCMVVITAMLLAVAAVGCGSDSDDDDDDNGAVATAPVAGDTPDDEEPTDEDPSGDAPSGSGSGTLSVDAKTLEFDVIFCGFTPEETSNDTVPFSMRGNGSDDGRGITVDGSIVDLSLVGSGSTSVTHTVAVWYDDDPATVIYSSETGEYQLDGNNVAYEGEFLGVGGLDSGQSVGTGVLEATCP